MTSCHIEADIWVEGGYLNGLKRVCLGFGGDNFESFMLGPDEAREVADAVESIAERDPCDPDRSEGLDLYEHGESMGVYPSGWDVAVRINGVEAIMDRSDSRELVGELRREASERSPRGRPEAVLELWAQARGIFP